MSHSHEQTDAVKYGRKMLISGLLVRTIGSWPLSTLVVVVVFVVVEVDRESRARTFRFTATRRLIVTDSGENKDSYGTSIIDVCTTVVPYPTRIRFCQILGYSLKNIWQQSKKVFRGWGKMGPGRIGQVR